MKVLLIYASRYGQTEKIAEAIAETARREGADARAANVESLPREIDLRSYDAVIIAGGVYYGRLARKLRRFVRHHAVALSHVHTALVAVSLSAKFEPADADEYVHTFVRQTGWLPETFKGVAGSEAFTKYGFYTGWVMRRIARRNGRGGDFSCDREYTDWEDLARFTREFLKKAAPVSASAVAAQP